MTTENRDIIKRAAIVFIIAAAFIIIPVPLNRAIIHFSFPYLLLEWFMVSLIICVTGLLLALVVIGIHQIILYIKYGD